MKIIIFGKFRFPFGFAATQLINATAEQFLAMGHRVHIIVAEKGARKPVVARKGKVPFTRISASLKCESAVTIHKVAKAYSRKDSVQDPNILIRYGLPDLSTMYVEWIARLNKYRICHWIVEDYSAYDIRKVEPGTSRQKILESRWFDRWLHMYTDGFVVISSWLFEKYRKRHSNVAKIPIATPYALQPSTADGPIRKYTITYAGTMGYKDGLDILIDAITIVRKTIPGVCLEIIGKGERESIYTRKCESIDYVKFTGYLDHREYWRHLCSSHVLCMTRLGSKFANAGFPYKMCEYLATGRPVLATRVGDVEEYLADGKDAFIVSPDNAIEMAERLIYILKNDHDASRVGQSGQRVCMSTFNPKINTRQFEYFLSKL